MVEFATRTMRQVTNRKASPPVTQQSAGMHNRIPQLDLSRQYELIRHDVLSAIERVCATQQFVLGGEVTALEQEISAFLSVKETVGCASGTEALWLALVACDVKAGDLVATTPFSFFASASAIVRTGARPVFIDVEPGTLNISAEALARQLSRGTAIRAVLPVHLYGQCADMERLQELCGKHHLALVEDAAQAFGAAWGGTSAGSWGDAAAFSFYPTKNLSAYGDAGCVTTDNKATAERMRRLRNHGSRERYFHEEIGWNGRLDAIQAAVLRVKLKHIEHWNGARRERAGTYERLLTKAGLLGDMKKPAPLHLLETASEATHIYHQFVIRAQRRDQLRAFLADRGVGSEIYYPLPLHLQKCFAYLGYAEGDFPEAERAAREVLALPMFPELKEDEQEYVVDSIADFYTP
jgi:dTDP-4-amino-4,6-dideoxygalactose transaminase